MRLQRGAQWSHMLLERESSIRRSAMVDRSEWYLPKTDALSSVASSLFVLSYLDPETQQFIDDSLATTESVCLQFWYAVSTAILSRFLSKTSINGVLGRGGMFLFSTNHMKEFLQLPMEWTPRGNMLLDLGSGDGGVTQHLASLFEKVHVTEMSQVMQWRLRQRGYEIIDANTWPSVSYRYSLISALNLLDRHFNPRQLLRDLHRKSSESECHVLLSLVLPIKPYVEFRPNGTSYTPDDYLSVSGRSMEEQAGSLIEGEFASAGFEVVRWTKLPYLCEGDLHKPYYMLNDAVFLLKPLSKPIVSDGTQLADGDVLSHGHIDL